MNSRKCPHCSYPETVLRNGSGHADTCPVQIEYRINHTIYTHVCPICESSDVDEYNVRLEEDGSGGAACSKKCHECGATWMVIYKFSEIMDLTPGE